MPANKFLSSILPPMLVFFDSMPTIKCVSEPNDLRNATFCHRVTKTNITESTSQWLADIIQFPSPPSISFFFVVQIFVFQTVYDCHLRISTGEKIKNYRGPTGFHPVTRRLGRPASRPRPARQCRVFFVFRTIKFRRVTALPVAFSPALVIMRWNNSIWYFVIRPVRPTVTIEVNRPKRRPFRVIYRLVVGIGAPGRRNGRNILNPAGHYSLS